MPGVVCSGLKSQRAQNFWASPAARTAAVMNYSLDGFCGPLDKL